MRSIFLCTHPRPVHALAAPAHPANVLLLQLLKRLRLLYTSSSSSSWSCSCTCWCTWASSCLSTSSTASSACCSLVPYAPVRHCSYSLVLVIPFLVQCIHSLIKIKSRKINHIHSLTARTRQRLIRPRHLLARPHGNIASTRLPCLNNGSSSLVSFSSPTVSCAQSDSSGWSSA